MHNISHTTDNTQNTNNIQNTHTAHTADTDTRNTSPSLAVRLQRLSALSVPSQQQSTHSREEEAQEEQRERQYDVFLRRIEEDERLVLHTSSASSAETFEDLTADTQPDNRVLLPNKRLVTQKYKSPFALKGNTLSPNRMTLRRSIAQTNTHATHGTNKKMHTKDSTNESNMLHSLSAETNRVINTEEEFHPTSTDTSIFTVISEDSEDDAYEINNEKQDILNTPFTNDRQQKISIREQNEQINHSEDHLIKESPPNAMHTHSTENNIQSSSSAEDTVIAEDNISDANISSPPFQASQPELSSSPKLHFRSTQKRGNTVSSHTGSERYSVTSSVNSANYSPSSSQTQNRNSSTMHSLSGNNNNAKKVINSSQRRSRTPTNLSQSQTISNNALRNSTNEQTSQVDPSLAILPFIPTDPSLLGYASPALQKLYRKSIAANESSHHRRSSSSLSNATFYVRGNNSTIIRPQTQDKLQTDSDSFYEERNTDAYPRSSSRYQQELGLKIQSPDSFTPDSSNRAYLSDSLDRSIEPSPSPSSSPLFTFKTYQYVSARTLPMNLSLSSVNSTLRDSSNSLKYPTPHTPLSPFPPSSLSAPLSSKRPSTTSYAKTRKPQRDSFIRPHTSAVQRAISSLYTPENLQTLHSSDTFLSSSLDERGTHPLHSSTRPQRVHTALGQRRHNTLHNHTLSSVHSPSPSPVGSSNDLLSQTHSLFTSSSPLPSPLSSTYPSSVFNTKRNSLTHEKSSAKPFT